MMFSFSQVKQDKLEDIQMSIDLEYWIRHIVLIKITIKRIISLILLFIWSFIFLKKIKPAVIHSHSPDLGFVCSFAARLYGRDFP